MENKTRITRLHLILGFIIIDLVFLIVGLMVWKFSSYKEVIDQISLISAISSILLALVAIVYAFFQTSSSSTQADALHNTLLNIDKKVTELDLIKDQLLLIKEDLTKFKEDSNTNIEALAKNVTVVTSGIDSLTRLIEEKAPIELKDEMKQKLDDLKKGVNKIFDNHDESGELRNTIYHFVYKFVTENYKIGDIVPIKVVLEKVINEIGFNAINPGFVTLSFKRLTDAGVLRTERNDGKSVYTLEMIF